MAETLYGDKLAGEITKDRYDAKKATIQKQLTDLRDELSIADVTTENRHEDAVEIIELTQTAKAQYEDSEMGNDAKRTVLTKLFDSVTYANNSVSVKLSFLAESITKRSAETRQIMKTQKTLNQTGESKQINRGVINKKDLKMRSFLFGRSFRKSTKPIYCIISFLRRARSCHYLSEVMASMKLD